MWKPENGVSKEGGRELTLIGFFPSESWNENLAQSFAILCMKVQILLRI